MEWYCLTPCRMSKREILKLTRTLYTLPYPRLEEKKKNSWKKSLTLRFTRGHRTVCAHIPFLKWQLLTKPLTFYL